MQWRTPSLWNSAGNQWTSALQYIVSCSFMHQGTCRGWQKALFSCLCCSLTIKAILHPGRCRGLGNSVWFWKQIEWESRGGCKSIHKYFVLCCVFPVNSAKVIAITILRDNTGWNNWRMDVFIYWAICEAQHYLMHLRCSPVVGYKYLLRDGSDFIS